MVVLQPYVISLALTTVEADFHEGREITYLQEINYLQEIQKYDKKIKVILTAGSYTSKFQLILCLDRFERA
jgi:hypothetical protein